MNFGAGSQRTAEQIRRGSPIKTFKTAKRGGVPISGPLIRRLPAGPQAGRSSHFSGPCLSPASWAALLKFGVPPLQ
jgi:hypothetical protein